MSELNHFRDLDQQGSSDYLIDWNLEHAFMQVMHYFVVLDEDLLGNLLESEQLDHLFAHHLHYFRHLLVYYLFHGHLNHHFV